MFCFFLWFLINLCILAIFIPFWKEKSTCKSVRNKLPSRMLDDCFCTCSCSLCKTYWNVRQENICGFPGHAVEREDWIDLYQVTLLELWRECYKTFFSQNHGDLLQGLESKTNTAKTYAHINAFKLIKKNKYLTSYSAT